jgi:hypothetical protein
MKLDTTTREAEWIEGLGGVFSVGSAPTVVTDPQNGDSVDSRVERGTFGHHHGWADRATHDENTHSVSDYTNDGGLSKPTGYLRRLVTGVLGNSRRECYSKLSRRGATESRSREIHRS